LSGGYLIPEGLDIAALSPDSPARLVEACYLFISLMLETAAMLVKRPKDRYIRLHSEKLRAVIDKRLLPQVKALLLSLGIIEIDSGYMAGETSKGYRLCFIWAIRKIVERPAATKQAKKLEKARFERVRPETPSQEEQVRTLARLKVDREEAEQAVLLQRPSAQEFYNTAISLIDHQKWFFGPDRAGRCHSNFTNFPGDLRKHLSLDGQRLAKIDVSAAQANIIAGKIKQEQAKQQDKSKDSIPMLSLFDDLTLMEGLLSEGRFYEWWGEMGDYESREKAKGEFVRWLNDTAKKTRWIDADRTARNYLPTVWEYRESFVGVLTEDGGPLLSRLLQQEESEWIVEGVCGRLHAAIPGIPLLTIHDCVATVPEHIDIVAATIKEVGFERYGFQPHVKVEL
jgi:hypothetical protein